MPRPAGKLVLEQLTEAAKITVQWLTMFLAGPCLDDVKPENLGDLKAKNVKVLAEVGPVVGVNRRMRLDEEDLPSRCIPNQLLPYHVRLVFLRGDRVDHHVAVGENGTEDVKMVSATSTVIWVLRIGVWAVD
jgi:hypothetical protein